MIRNRRIDVEIVYRS